MVLPLAWCTRGVPGSPRILVTSAAKIVLEQVAVGCVLGPAPVLVRKLLAAAEAAEGDAKVLIEAAVVRQVGSSLPQVPLTHGCGGIA